MRRRFLAFYIVLLTFFFNNPLLSWEEGTHELITGAAFTKFLKGHQDFYLIYGFDLQGRHLLMGNGNVERSVGGWLNWGANREDAGSLINGRYYNHFHDPNEDLSGAGLDFFVKSYYSSILWSLDASEQQSYPEGDQTWSKARNQYWAAMVSTVDTNRQLAFANTFKAIGHQLHLMQDCSVPAHVRNDAHPTNSLGPLFNTKYGYYRDIEGWAVNYPEYISDLCKSIVEGGSPLTAVAIDLTSLEEGWFAFRKLADRDMYDGTNPSVSLSQGLAEYTNANYVSEDTIFKNYSFPRAEGTNYSKFKEGTLLSENFIDKDGIPRERVYIKKVGDGEVVDHFLRVGYFGKGHGLGYVVPIHETLYHDHTCYEDYMAKLLPRAIGYSQSLLDYFFRGKIEVSLPDSGIYGLVEADPDDTYGGKFDKITLKIRNITPKAGGGFEEMVNGEIKLVLRYRLASGDVEATFNNSPPKPVSIIDGTNRYDYIVGDPVEPVNSIPSNEDLQLTFQLPQDRKLPLNATCLSLQVVFKGKLGDEEGAVALGFKDISEPTLIDVCNNSEYLKVFREPLDGGEASWQTYRTSTMDSFRGADVDGNDKITGPADFTGPDALKDGCEKTEPVPITIDLYVNRVKFSPEGTGEPGCYPSDSEDYHSFFDKFDQFKPRRYFVIGDQAVNVAVKAEKLYMVQPHYVTNQEWWDCINKCQVFGITVPPEPHGEPHPGYDSEYTLEENKRTYRSVRLLKNQWHCTDISTGEFERDGEEPEYKFIKDSLPNYWGGIIIGDVWPDSTWKERDGVTKCYYDDIPLEPYFGMGSVKMRVNVIKIPWPWVKSDSGN